LLAVGALLTAGCAVAPFAIREAASGQLRAAPNGDGVAGAEVIATSHERFFADRPPGRVVDTYATRTDARGRFRVPARFALQFVIFAPDVVPAFASTLRLTAPSGASIVVPAPSGGATAQESPLTVRPDDPPASSTPVLIPTMGGIVGGGERLAAYGGAVLFLIERPLWVGLHADARLGIGGGSAGAGLVVMPAFRMPLPLPGLELGARVLRPWLAPRDVAFGPEVTLTFLGLRVAVAALAPHLRTPLGDRRYLVGVGFGYL
jgi:hypothetical protein